MRLSRRGILKRAGALPLLTALSALSAFSFAFLGVNGPEGIATALQWPN